MADFFDRFEYLCKQKGENTTSLGTQLGFSKSTISGWRNRTSVPSGKTLERLCSYFEVSADYLLGKSDLREPEKQFDDVQMVKIALFGTEDVPPKAWMELERVVAHLKRKYAIGKDR
ncbi:MAG: helix-turn-helix transcriptional regulator [Clostridia bacterium]|nr:helix-turn-helix transcriptional regulator [Clostridia bacterium]